MPVELSEDQVLWFRTRRGHLAGAGAPNAVAAARAIVGAQSQQLGPWLHALSMRSRGRPTAVRLRSELLERRRLVRTWGQRDTLFVYDPADWPLIVAARDHWSDGGRGGPMPTRAVLDKAMAIVEASPSPVTRTDMLGVAPKGYERALAERAALANMDPRRLVAGRLIWKLAHRGEVCVADKVGAEQSYAARTDWFPDLEWTEPTPLEACAALSRRYLSVYGPATVNDLAHFFNAKVTTARSWLAEIEGELAAVACADRKALVALKKDTRALTEKPPAGAKDWPVRLLPLWESLLMGHADKSWTVPDEAERKRVWKKAGYVCAVVLARGRVVATWSQCVKRSVLHVEVAPLSGWSGRTHAASVRREAKTLADHLELESAEVTVA